jgi:hypothetical protein
MPCPIRVQESYDRDQMKTDRHFVDLYGDEGAGN